MIGLLRALAMACGRAQAHVAACGEREPNRDERRGGAAMLDRGLDAPGVHPVHEARRQYAHRPRTR